MPGFVNLMWPHRCTENSGAISECYGHDAQGWLPPWPHWWGEQVMAELIPDPDQRRRFAAGCPPLPVAMFEETHPAVPDWPDAPAGYLQLSEAYHGQADMARHLGWPSSCGTATTSPRSPIPAWSPNRCTN